MLPDSVSNTSPNGRLVGEIPNEATAPPPKVGYTLTTVSLPTVIVPFSYSIVAISSLIVKLKLMFLVAPSLLTCKVNIELVKLTVGVPHIVPLELPNCNPSGSSGTICHEIMLPLISEGTIGDIGLPLSNINSVSLYVTVGLPLPIPNEILKNIFPNFVSLAHIV